MSIIPRKTKHNDLTSDQLIKKINPENTRLKEDFIAYLESTQKSPGTIYNYENDMNIFFVWNLQNNRDKFFVDVTKRDIVSFQNWLIKSNENSPARVRRIKSSLSSLSNYIENILDDEYPMFRNIIKKVENPVNRPVREKTVFDEEKLKGLLDLLVENHQYQKACMLSLAMCSGSRKSELCRFKVSYFDDENIILGSLYRTPEKMKTKGRSLGKYIERYVMAKPFKPYLDLWLEERKNLNADSDWLFPVKNKDGKWEHIKISTLDSWAETFSKLLETDFYWHSLRHYFTTELSRSGLPDSVIKEIIGWDSTDMVQVYKDISTVETLEQYFDNGSIKSSAKTISDL